MYPDKAEHEESVCAFWGPQPALIIPQIFGAMLANTLLEVF